MCIVYDSIFGIKERHYVWMLDYNGSLVISGFNTFFGMHPSIRDI